MPATKAGWGQAAWVGWGVQAGCLETEDSMTRDREMGRVIKVSDEIHNRVPGSTGKSQTGAGKALAGVRWMGRSQSKL